VCPAGGRRRARGRPAGALAPPEHNEGDRELTRTEFTQK
jgi:hypothetical protein